MLNFRHRLRSGRGAEGGAVEGIVGVGCCAISGRRGREKLWVGKMLNASDVYPGDQRLFASRGSPRRRGRAIRTTSLQIT